MKTFLMIMATALSACTAANDVEKKKPVVTEETKPVAAAAAATAAPSAATKPKAASPTSATLPTDLSKALGLVAPDSGPNPSEVTIRSFSYAGSGCPASTVSSNLSPDAKALTVLFAEFNASIGEGVDPALARRNCQLNVDLQAPVGYSYSLFKVDTRGFANLDAGVTGIVSSTYYFQGSQLDATFDHVLTGPTSEDFQVQAEPTLESDVQEEPWSSCEGASRSLNINTQVSLDAGGSQAGGLLAVDSIDGELTHVYGVKWRRCAATPPAPPPPPPPPAALMSVYVYDFLEAGVMTLKNRLYYHELVSAPGVFSAPWSSFPAFPSPTGTAEQAACAPKQLVQCHVASINTWYMTAGGCVDPASQVEVYKLNAFVCSHPVPGKTSPLSLLYSPTYGTVTTPDEGFKAQLIQNLKFIDLGVVAHAPITSF